MYKELTNCPLFRGLSEAQVKEVLASGENYSVDSYGRGDVIALRDTAYSGLMIVLEGVVVGRITYSDGKTVDVDTLDAAAAPQLIAPAFLFGGYNRLPIDVIALTDGVKIMTLHRGFIFEIIQQNTVILSNFIDIISNRANVWAKKIFFLSFRSLKEKAASFLLSHSTEEQPFVPMPDIAEIADVFAATRSSLVAVLDDMQKRQIISWDDKGITILNRKTLNDIIK